MRSLPAVLSDELAPDIQAFMLASVDSYEQLEILLLLHREQAAPWTAAQVAEALQISLAAAASSLDELAGRRLLTVTRGSERSHRYAPADADTADVVDRLARAYEDRRVAVIDLMSANAMSRIRRSALRTFAEAFRVTGAKKRDG
ncbi:hypothetical protein [Anaeromyxobacter sp. SG26]|uniref:hypothetical protein n=1 Tax=Anaeromyxobacter sp. SG26 TaxID=2925407 RepID=UPI001F58D062|nr:hypothetical protein [Anaeromyxobacter sp. SG26]